MKVDGWIGGQAMLVTLYVFALVQVLFSTMVLCAKFCSSLQESNN